MNTGEITGLGRALFTEAGDGLFLYEPDTEQLVDVNPILTAGDMNQTVEVTAEVPLVTFNDPTDATTLDQKRIENTFRHKGWKSLGA